MTRGAEIKGLLVVACALALGAALLLFPSAASAATPPWSGGAGPATGDPGGQYWLAAADGGIFSFGGSFYGSTGSMHLNQPIVGMASTPDGRGYWLVAADGGIFSFGDAPFYGSTASMRLRRPIVGMASTPDGRGYWLVGSDGGIFTFGDARYYGSTGGSALSQPIVGMAATPDGRGYWLVGSDGGIFSFGDARYYGSTGGMHLNKPVVGMASTPDGEGYWLVAADGGIFSFGDAPFYGSTGGMHLNKPVVGMEATPDGRGYWLVASDGGIFSFGDAPFYGSTGGMHLNKPVIGMAGGAGTHGTSSYDPCPGDPPIPGTGATVAESVRVPAVPYESLPGATQNYSFPPAQEVPDGFIGTLVSPATGKGRLPGVVVLHGVAGNQCQMWSFARFVASQGFVVLTLTVPAPAGAAPASYGIAIDAGRAGVDFLSSGSENPAAQVTLGSDIGVAGWSEGSIAASEVQDLPDMGAVHAIVALDNLHSALAGDPGAPVNWCVPPVDGPITPKVPALGFASDSVCPQNSSDTSPTLKQSGWQLWQQASLPSVELVLAGSNHWSYSAPGQDLDLSAAWSAAWLEAWLDGETSSLDTFTACTTAGQPTASLLASDFYSAGYLPAADLPPSGLNTSNLGAWLSQKCG